MSQIPHGPVPTRPSVAAAVSPAFRFAWDTFTTHWGRLVAMYAIVAGAVLVVVVPFWIAMVVTFTRWAVEDAYGRPTPDQPPVWLFVGYGAMFVVIGVASLLSQLWSTRLGLDVTAGRDIGLRRFFTLRGLGRAAGAAVVIAIATGIGTLLCWIPGVLIAVLTMFVVPLMLDRGLSFGDAVSESGRLVRTHLGGCLLFMLASWGVLLVGELTVIGLLVAMPLSAILGGCLYREVVSRG